MTVTLLHGDCLDILPTLPDMCADAIITDVPYGTTACKWDVIIPLDKMWEQVKRLCKGAFVTTSQQPFTSVLITSNLKRFKYEWIWTKREGTRYLDVHRRPLLFHENICVFSQNGHVYNPQKTKAKPRFVKREGSKVADQYSKHIAVSSGNNGESYPRSCIEFGRENGNQHPTQKPVALYEYLIRTYTNPGDTVLDFCMGSGTTGVSCVKTNRNFIGIEKERNYFDIASRRIAEAQLQMVMPL
jgi:DNA modification methylase